MNKNIWILKHSKRIKMLNICQPTGCRILHREVFAQSSNLEAFNNSFLSSHSVNWPIGNGQMFFCFSLGRQKAGQIRTFNRRTTPCRCVCVIIRLWSSQRWWHFNNCFVFSLTELLPRTAMGVRRRGEKRISLGPIFARWNEQISLLISGQKSTKTKKTKGRGKKVTASRQGQNYNCVL